MIEGAFIGFVFALAVHSPRWLIPVIIALAIYYV